MTSVDGKPSDGVASDVSQSTARPSSGRSSSSASRAPTLDALLDASQAALRSGQCIEGAALARKAVETAVVAGDQPRRAAGLALLAKQLTRAGEFEATAATCEQAALIFRDLDDLPGLCDVLVVQALALNSLSLSDEALDVLAVGRDVASRLNDTTWLYWVLNRIAVVHAGLEDFRRAYDFQMRALALSTGLDEESRFCIINNISDNAIGLFRQMREENDPAADAILREGLANADDALALAVATRNPYRQALSLDNGGVLLGLAGDYDAAFEKLARARQIAAGRGYQSMELGAHFHSASVLLQQGRISEAVPQLEAVLRRSRELAEPPIQLQILLEISRAAELTGDFRQALQHYKDWVALDRQLRSTVAATRARMLVNLVDLDTARLDAADAREESQILRDRSRELEEEKRELEALAAVLDRRANEDALTRLSNRHHLEAELPRLHREAVEHGLALAVVVIDIDHFKHVNDTFGHAVGDTVLVQVATLLNRDRRAGDLIGRMGGEEFLIAFPGLDEESAVEVCERLRRTVETHDWDALRPGLRVTASLGVCALTDEPDVYQLIERADSRMYLAKRAGRNRVEWYSGLESAS